VAFSAWHSQKWQPKNGIFPNAQSMPVSLAISGATRNRMILTARQIPPHHCFIRHAALTLAIRPFIFPPRHKSRHALNHG